MRKQAFNYRMVRVIRDVRDANIDYMLPAWQAREMFESKLLLWDATNGCYCTPTTKRVDYPFTVPLRVA